MGFGDGSTHPELFARTPLNLGGNTGALTSGVIAFGPGPISPGQAVGAAGGGYWIALQYMATMKPLPIGIITSPIAANQGGTPSHGVAGGNEFWHFSLGYAPAGGLT